MIKRLNENEAAFNALRPEAAAAQLPRLSAPLVSLFSKGGPLLLQLPEKGAYMLISYPIG